MIRKKSKLTAIFILVAMLLGLFPSSAFAGTWLHQETAPEFETVIYQNDGTNIDGLTGTFTQAKDDNGNECLSLGRATYVKQLFKKFDTEKAQGIELINDDGQCMISFDFCAMQKTIGLNMYIDDSSGKSSSYPVFILTGGGMMYYNDQKTEPAATYLPSYAVPYESERWYNVKMVLYTNDSYIDYYIDDIYWGRQMVPRGYWMNLQYGEERIIKQIFFNHRPTWALDADGIVTDPDGSGEIFIDNFTYGLPQKRDVELSFWQNEEGNIYDGADVNFGCDIINRTAKREKFTFNYEIRTDKNKLIKKKSEGYTLNAGENKAVTLLNTAPEYGFFTADVELYNSNGELVVKDYTRFSIIRPQNGLNMRVGVNVHNTGHGDSKWGTLEETRAVVEKLGIGNIRDSLIWQSMYEEDAETHYANHYFLDKMKEVYGPSDVEILCFTSILPEAEKMDYNDERVPDLLKRYEKYCYNLASELGETVTYYEIQNEWWLHGDVNAGGVAMGPANDVSANIQLYAEIMKIASKAIKSANPNAKIVGFSGIGNGQEDWVRAVLDALGENPGQYFDIISMHDYMTYWGSTFPEQHLEDGTEEKHKGGIKRFLKIFEEYGLQDKILWSSEFGINENYNQVSLDAEHMADFTIRQLMLHMQYYDVAYVYCLQRKIFDISEYEAGFGLVNAGICQEITREARPAAIQLAAYNSLLNRAELMSRQVIGNDGQANDSKDIYIYKYKMTNGKECYVIFNATSEGNVSFDLGVNSATVCDEYGNENTISALDGYITLNVTTAPTYVIADDLKENVTVRETPIFDIPQAVKTARDDIFSISVTKNTNSYVEAFADCSANMEFSGKTSFNGGVSELNFVTYNDTQDDEWYIFDDRENTEEVVVSVKNGSKVYYKAPVTVKYIEPLGCDLRILPYRSGRWQVIMELKNNKRTSPLWGKIDISTGDSKEIENLLAGQKSIIRFNIPENASKNNYGVTAQITLDDGSVMTETAATNFISVEKAYTPPKIDGEFENGEWRSGGTPIAFNRAEQYVRVKGSAQKWNGLEDLSGEMYLMYDDEKFYLGAKIRDDIHCGDDQGRGLWAMDGIEFCIAQKQEKFSGYTDIVIALDDEGNSKIDKLNDVANVKEEIFDESKLNEFDEGTELKIARRGEYTTYELQIPWTELTIDGKAPSAELIFSVLVNESDKTGRYSWIEWASGIGKGKDPSKFAKVPFNY